MGTARLLPVMIAMGLSAQAQDHRLDRLNAFLAKRPASQYAAEFLAASDRYELDWRLLPAICVMETSGGRHVRSRNNWFGWDSGRTRFRTVNEAIDKVARALAEGKRYRGRTLSAKLHVYNHGETYPHTVQRFMARISHSPHPGPSHSDVAVPATLTAAVPDRTDGMIPMRLRTAAPLPVNLKWHAAPSRGSSLVLLSAQRVCWARESGRVRSCGRLRPSQRNRVYAVLRPRERSPTVLLE